MKIINSKNYVMESLSFFYVESWLGEFYLQYTAQFWGVILGSLLGLIYAGIYFVGYKFDGWSYRLFLLAMMFSLLFLKLMLDDFRGMHEVKLDESMFWTSLLVASGLVIFGIMYQKWCDLEKNQ